MSKNELQTIYICKNRPEGRPVTKPRLTRKTIEIISRPMKKQPKKGKKPVKKNQI